MKIVVLGAGAMGGLYGALLSQKNDVTLIDTNTKIVDIINNKGLEMVEKSGVFTLYHPSADTFYKESTPADLVIVFVKSLYSRIALEANKAAIGKDTYILTLQNGSGHETILQEFTDLSHIIIGTTQHNASISDLGVWNHGGSGTTYLGTLNGDLNRIQFIADAFNECGLETKLSDQVLKMIWNKMFTNVSASVLTGILQVPLGFISKDTFAWNLCCKLIQEAVQVADKLGLSFDVESKIEEVQTVCNNSPNGITSIYADLQAHRLTEVDTISGSVVAAGQKCGVPTPTHEIMVQLVHAMEERNKQA